MPSSPPPRNRSAGVPPTAAICNLKSSQISFRSGTVALGRVSHELSVPPSLSTRQRNPARVCANRWRWSGSVTRPHQALETHLKRWRELAGRRPNISTSVSSGMRGRAPPPPRAAWGLDPRYRPHPLRSSQLPHAAHTPPSALDSRLEGGVNRAKLKFTKIITTTSRG
jgi:hypothetical protein